MINKDLFIDFEKKIITRSKNWSKKTYSVPKLYSYLMDTFDEPENMRYDIPIIAVSKNEYKMINGWSLDKDVRSIIKGKLE